MDKNQREERRRQEDTALNRGLIWVGAAIVLELLLLLVNKYYINIYTTMESVNLALAIGKGLKALRILTLVGMAVCAVWTWLSLSRHAKAAVPAILLIACTALFFCSHIAVSFRDAGVRMLFLLVPAWAALALVYYLYQREFFFSAALSGMGVVALWLVRHQGSGKVTLYVFLAVFAVVLAAGAAALNKARQNRGELKLAGRTVQLLPKEAGYATIWVTAAANVAAVVLGLVLGGTVAYYLMYVLVAWLFGLLVYYTVKMM